MTFQQTIDYLYSRLPVFQNQGARAYKPGLTTTRQFCQHLGDPHTRFRSIHVGGTNGKGSTSHMLASVLQNAGYKVGLYTSPHLKSFTERIRLNGKPVEEEFIVDFVRKHKSFIERIQPSFFEVTVAMAFDYFAQQEVNIAIIEVGMGGRLDSTNVITPLVSIITNISFDHMQHLGDTLPKIAREKAGIIKPGVPVVISEEPTEEVMEVFEHSAIEQTSTLYPAFKLLRTLSSASIQGKLTIEAEWTDTLEREVYEYDLSGSYQLANYKGVLVALRLLETMGFPVNREARLAGLKSVVETTGLKGRWQTLGQSPLVLCDTAHNFAGLSYTLAQFSSIAQQSSRFVLGFVADKDLSSILTLFPKQGIYYFCQPSNPRALPASELAGKARDAGLNGNVYLNVNEALNQAVKDSDKNDAIYVGGSTFVVADLDLV